MTNSTTPNSKNQGENLVHIEHDGNIAILSINDPPVNALSRELRHALISRLSALASDASVDGIVLKGANDTFVTGADLREFGKPLTEPTLPEVLATIEACPKPVVAAIHGAALGGGYEIALACDGRVAVQDAVIGLPEGTFGIIPGAGGTARITRLTDAATALEIVSSCRRVKSSEALQLGLIDSVVADLRNDAIAFVRALNGEKRRLRDLPAKPVSAEDFEKAAQGAIRRARGRPYANDQVAALKRAFTEPFNQVIVQDRAAFQRLRDSTESTALRHLFFAERDAARVDGIAGLKPSAVRSVGIVGAGTMGSGIAAAFLAAGFPVTLLDLRLEALDAAHGRIAGFLAKATQPASLVTTSDFADFASCDLVLEAVFEDMAIKQELMRKLDEVTRPDAILASNTSYLDLNEIATASAHPNRVIGLHFFAPAHVMKLLEIVRGAKTSPEVLASALKLGRALGKVAVVSGVGEGFIGNRIYNAYRTQCEAMLLDGALPQEVDSAIEAFGFAMGPFSVSDLSGLDIAWANRRRRQATTGDKSDVPVLEWLVSSGRLGRKTGAGWYRYEDGKKMVDKAVDKLVEKSRAEAHVSPRHLSREEIQLRAMAAIVNEALLVLEEGIAARPSDIDLVMINGYGFPKHLGGPLHWAKSQDRDKFENYLSFATETRQRGDLDLILT